MWLLLPVPLLRDCIIGSQSQSLADLGEDQISHISPWYINRGPLFNPNKWDYIQRRPGRSKMSDATTSAWGSSRIGHIIAILILSMLLGDHLTDATAINRGFEAAIDNAAVEVIQTDPSPVIKMEVRAVSPTSAGSSSSATSLPQPFDTSIGTNFTSNACPAFFNTFLGDPSFLDCYPFSLLLQTSQAFFSAEKSFFKVTQALDVTCNVDSAVCAKVMSNYATQIKSNSNCGLDYQQNNPIVVQAYSGLSSYSVMYQAGCLKDANGSYCFANAITGVSPVADSYLYYLPLGTGLPPTAKPSCSYCVQNIMSLYSGAAKSASQIVSKTYNPAANQINNICGANYVTPNVVAAANGLSAPSAALILTAVFSLFLLT